MSTQHLISNEQLLTADGRELVVAIKAAGPAALIGLTDAQRVRLLEKAVAHLIKKQDQMSTFFLLGMDSDASCESLRFRIQRTTHTMNYVRLERVVTYVADPTRQEDREVTEGPYVPREQAEAIVNAMNNRIIRK